MARLFSLLCALLLAFSGLSQPDLTGSWKGVLTQKQGGYSSEYNFELYLIQEGDQLTGRSYVSIDDIHAEMEIVGELMQEKVIRFREIRFVDFTELHEMEWCYKIGVLRLVKEKGEWKLQGLWEGFTDQGSCIPGKIFLTKVIPRA